MVSLAVSEETVPSARRLLITWTLTASGPVSDRRLAAVATVANRLGDEHAEQVHTRADGHLRLPPTMIARQYLLSRRGLSSGLFPQMRQNYQISSAYEEIAICGNVSLPRVD
jgi:hypothetical protein